MLQLWIPALIWLAVIACESILMSAGETSRFILPLLHLLLPHGTEQQLAFLHAMLRKAGHFTGYSILSLLLYRAWWGTIVLRNVSPRSNRIPGWNAMLGLWSARAAILACLGTVLVAAMDELQQSLHANRTASAKDVLLDSAGGWFVQMMILAFSSGRMRTRYDAWGSRPREGPPKISRSPAERADRPAESSSGSSAP
jgi:VanZ family protein